MALLIGKHEVFSLSLAKSDGAISLAKVGDVEGSSIVCAASASKDLLLYYVSEEARDTVMQWSASTGGKGTSVVKLPAPAVKMVFYRNKIFCSAVDGTSLMCVDPLNLTVESLDTHHAVVDFAPADFGFVVEDKEGRLYGYHFNYGACKVTDVSGGAELLGHYKRHAVAMVPCKGIIVTVDERGAVAVLPDAVKNVTSSFVTAGDDVFVYKRSSQTVETADGAATCAVPAEVVAGGVVILSSVPEIENEETCTLCFCEFEGKGDGITLDCGHRFHTDCVMQWVGRWDEFKAKGNHIAFTNAVCPGGCKHLARHPLLGSVSESIRRVSQNVTAQSKKILQTMPATKLEEDLLFYVCANCGDAFYGGEKVCFRAQGGEPTKMPGDLICEKCQTDFRCPTHDREFVVYKCFYCCNPATDRSFGNRYHCNRCSARWTSTTEPDPIPCPGDAKCPLGGHGHEVAAYPIGCLVCSAEGTIDYDKIVPAP